MADTPFPTSLAVPFTALLNVRIEYHRLATWLELVDPEHAGPARHALRKLHDFLTACEIEVESLDGKPFSAGLAARVIDSVDDPTLPEGQSFVIETLAPLLRYRGNVIKPAEVVVRGNIKR